MADNNRYGSYGRGDDRGADQTPNFNHGFGSGYGARTERDPYAGRGGSRGYSARGVDDRFDGERGGNNGGMDQGESRGRRDELLYGQRGRHSASGLEVFDRSLQSTHIWLNEIIDEIGPDKQVAWHALTAVLRTIRDRVPLETAVHLGAQLPLLVRGAYYDQFRLTWSPERTRHLDEFLGSVADHMRGIARPVNPRNAFEAVARTLTRHISEGQVRKVLDSLPDDVRRSWLGAVRDLEALR